MTTKPWKRYLITVFIVFNIVGILVGQPEFPSQRNALHAFFQPYLVWTRLLQRWKLFVPEPRRYAVKYRTDIKFKDGSVTSWVRPYPPKWDFFERHLSYNFQKWDLATGFIEEPGLLWPDLADFVTRLFWSDTNPPAELIFVRSRAMFPPPNETGYVMFDHASLQWEEKPIFKHIVPDDFAVKRHSRGARP